MINKARLVITILTATRQSTPMLVVYSLFFPRGQCCNMPFCEAQNGKSQIINAKGTITV